MDLQYDLILSVLLALIPTILILYALITDSFYDYDEFNDYILTFFLFCVSFFSSIILFYPLINLLFNLNSLSLDYFINELQSGILSLRITSVISGAYCLFYIIHYVLTEELLDADRLIKRSDDFPELKKLSEVMELSTIDLIILGQYGFYLLITGALWLQIISELNTPIQAVISWALFFIIDDWTIISKYGIELKGRIFKTHRIRILTFNIILFGLTTYSLYINYSIFVMVAFILLTATLLSLRYSVENYIEENENE